MRTAPSAPALARRLARTKRGTASVGRSPWNARRLPNWRKGWTWPWVGYGRRRTWPPPAASDAPSQT
uniref:Uncharacterized protein n=1 Tax=Arundo donax TaxID=35708 RepID=A0A0A9D3B0_ARUDO